MMEKPKVKTLILGEGKEAYEAFLTLDLIPIHIIFRYDVEIIEKEISNFDHILDETKPKTRKVKFKKAPHYVENFYTVDIYQKVIDLVCEGLNLEERVLFGHDGPLPVFSFKNDMTFYEFQYKGYFGKTYYTESKIRHALKAYETYRSIEWGVNQRSFQSHYNTVIEHIKKQKVFSSRDYLSVSPATLDKFISTLTQKNR